MNHLGVFIRSLENHFYFSSEINQHKLGRKDDFDMQFSEIHLVVFSREEN
jgi:hypothetical protein